MRLSKYQVVGVTLACLLLSGSAQAQFGQLKSLAKDKLGMKSKEARNPAAEAEGQNKGSAGEAKATFAPGVKKIKSVDVSRQSGPTPEASASRQSGPAPDANIAAIESGRSQEVSIKVSHVDARQFDAVRGYSPCNKLSNFQILSATQMKVTIDLKENKSGRTCSLYFRSGGETVFSANVSIRAKK